MPTLSAHHKANFQTLRRAVKNGHAALVDCQLLATGQPVAVICAVNVGQQYELMPLAILFDGNPFELLAPPKPGGGYDLPPPATSQSTP